MPFPSPMALYGLSRLSVWWLRPGIQIERINPGHPEQNGRHKRMHPTLKQATPNHRTTISCSSRPNSRASSMSTTTITPSDFGHEMPWGQLSSIRAALSRPTRARIPVSTPHYHRHPVRANLCQHQENQSELGLRRTERRYQAGGGEYLVSELHAERYRIARSGSLRRRTSG